MTHGTDIQLARVGDDEGYVVDSSSSVQNRAKELLICAEGLRDLERLLVQLTASYRVSRAASEQELLRRSAQQKFDLLIVDGRFYERALLDELLVHQQPRSILFLADNDHIDSLADAVASQHEIRVLASTGGIMGLIEHIESLLFPRLEQRHCLPEMFLEVRLPDGGSTMLPIADISNRGCAVYLRSEQAFYVPCVPGAVLTSSRVVSRNLVLMDQVDATVRYVDAVEKHSDLHDARLGLEFIKSDPVRDDEGHTEERITDPVQAFALIKEGLKKKKRSGVLEVLDSDPQVSVVCVHLDFDARQLRLAAVDAIGCQPGDVVRISFELGGARYTFLSSVMAAIPAELQNELLITLPRAIVKTRRRAHHRLKPTSGQVTISAPSPFGTGTIETDALDLASSGVSFRVDGSHDLFPIGALIRPLTLTFGGHAAFAVSGRVRSLAELPNRS
ncbi:MAG: hypothetical protein WCF10_13565, partial [Polyangiales bacterium]